jgi:hypothetical protein
MTTSRFRHTIGHAVLAIIGTGFAFAFLANGAFRSLGAETWVRLWEPISLRAAGLGAGTTALLLVPVLLWEYRRSKREAA